MKQTLLFLLFSFLFAPLFGQDARSEYIKKYSKLAIAEMMRCGIPASITLAQGCLESNNGRSELATEGNNHFGIKCKKDWTGKRIYHDDDEKGECFRRYAHAEESYTDHSDFLRNSPRYAFLFQLDPTDYVGWARGLKQAGYATAPDYADRLIRIIEENQLYAYDDGLQDQQLASLQHTPNEHSSHGKTLAPLNHKHKVEMRNGLRSVIVSAGDSFDSIAKEFGERGPQLYDYNDFEKGQRLQVNQILYLEKKHRKAAPKNKIHIAEEGDTMHYIAQRYGIRLKPLMHRNRMKKDEEPTVGQKIYLRTKAKR